MFPFRGHLDQHPKVLGRHPYLSFRNDLSSALCGCCLFLGDVLPIANLPSL